MAEFNAPDGTRLYFEEHGDPNGLPVLCLAGLTRTTRDFTYVRPTLAGTRMIAMDYRGRGRSAWANAETYTIQNEGGDALALLDHLGISAAAILGTSRGGLIGIGLAAAVPDRINGLMLNDIGPVLELAGLQSIGDYIGVRPTAQTHEDMATILENTFEGFTNVPRERWLSEARHQYIETPSGIDLSYDPALRDGVLKALASDVPDGWPLFDLIGDIPLGVIRGAGSNLLSAATVTGMQERRPDMIVAEVPDRGHVPFLDEPAAVAAITRWLEAL